MKKRNLTSLCLIGITAATVTMGDGPDSIGVPEAAWENPSLGVCWQSSRSKVARESGGWSKMNYNAEAPSAKLQSDFASWVNGAYSSERTGVSFHGFGNCPDDPTELKKYPVYLVNDMNLFNLLGWIFGGKTLGVSDIGDRNRYVGQRTERTLVFKPSKKYSWLSVPEWQYTKVPYKAAVGFDLTSGDEIITKYVKRFSDGIETALGFDPKTTNPNDTQKVIRAEAEKEEKLLLVEGNKYTALHELGHLVGLLHEDRRKDAADRRPKYCVNVAGDKNNENDGTFKKEELFSTEYDPFSIMSYCRETMQRLFHQAKLVCRLEGKLDAKTKTKIAPFLKNCEEVAKLNFPVDLTPRDVNALRQMYLKEAPRTAEWASYKAAPAEVRLYEILEDSARLPFDPIMVEALKRADKEKDPNAAPPQG